MVCWQKLIEQSHGSRRLDIVASAFTNSFNCIAVFHACRPRSVASYYKYGLRLPNTSKLTQQAHSIFLSGRFPQITEDIFNQAVNRLQPTTYVRTHVCLDDRGYFDGAGHYLIYGSEHICAIAANLTNEHTMDYRQVLKLFGKPTIFRLRLGLRLISESNFNEFVKEVKNHIPRSNRISTMPVSHFTFFLGQNLVPSCVLGDYHPKVILDPLLRMQRYEYQGSAA